MTESTGRKPRFAPKAKTQEAPVPNNIADVDISQPKIVQLGTMSAAQERARERQETNKFKKTTFPTSQFEKKRILNKGTIKNDFDMGVLAGGLTAVSSGGASNAITSMKRHFVGMENTSTIPSESVNVASIALSTNRQINTQHSHAINRTGVSEYPAMTIEDATLIAAKNLNKLSLDDPYTPVVITGQDDFKAASDNATFSQFLVHDDLYTSKSIKDIFNTDIISIIRLPPTMPEEFKKEEKGSHLLGKLRRHASGRLSLRTVDGFIFDLLDTTPKTSNFIQVSNATRVMVIDADYDQAFDLGKCQTNEWIAVPDVKYILSKVHVEMQK